MASLQARHNRDCAIVVRRKKVDEETGNVRANQWTPFDKATKKAGCSCTPLYYIVLRHDKKLVREPVGHNRKEAVRALDARRGDVARRTYRVIRDITFAEWADEWLASATIKENSRRVYAHSIEYAKQMFGRVKVRDLGPDDIGRYLDLIRKAHLDRQRPKPDAKPTPISDATLAKHLRQLGACLQAAIPTYATENPVRLLHRSMRPKAEKPTAVYYTDDELVRLWPEFADRPVMAAFVKLAVGTGMRFGELAALRWSDVDLLNREVYVSRTFVEGLGEQPSTKSGEPRTVDLTVPAAKVLEDWYTQSRGDGLVFEREEGGHLAPSYVTAQVLYPALERAGIPRVGERGRKRDFHSLRHTFARKALEGGAEITWVSQQLGHSNITLTVNTYGHWARSAQKAQAERLTDAFAL